jgi:hypothetical protein
MSNDYNIDMKPLAQQGFNEMRDRALLAEGIVEHINELVTEDNVSKYTHSGLVESIRSTIEPYYRKNYE